MNELLILHADQTVNASAFAAMITASTGNDLWGAICSAIVTLAGPLHGGANAEALKELRAIQHRPENTLEERVAAYIEESLQTGHRIHGVGSIMYKTTDPRSKAMKKTSWDKENPIMQAALELERQIDTHPYFQERKLGANVDFFSGILQGEIGIPASFLPLTFAVGRAVGWIAHINEHPDRKTIRPRLVYQGESKRSLESCMATGNGYHGSNLQKLGNTILTERM